MIVGDGVRWVPFARPIVSHDGVVGVVPIVATDHIVQMAHHLRGRTGGKGEGSRGEESRER